MSREGREAFSSLAGFLANPWTRTVLPLVVVGGVSWGVFKQTIAQLERTVAANTSRTEATLNVLTEDVQTLKVGQEKDDIFRESGERFNAGDAAKLELRLQNQFRGEIKELTGLFSSKIDASQRESIRRLERLEEKLDNVSEKLR